MEPLVVEAPPAAPARPKRRDLWVIGAVLAVVAVGVVIAAANPRPPDVPDARAAGADVYRDGTLYRVDGTTMRLDPPDEGRISEITAVPAGYLLDVSAVHTNEAWLLDAGGTPRQLA